MSETERQENLDSHPCQLPEHIAIIMDGNGRWAEARGKKRVQGHKQGMERAREIVQCCGEAGIKALTLFAFSSENWQRPEDEVSFLMNLFVTGLTRESKSLHKNNVQLRVIGDVCRFDTKLQKAIADAETLTQHNDGIVLQIAANYGGQWDILQAANQAFAAKLTGSQQPGESVPTINQEELEHCLSGADLPLPDLMIRTGGEHRISNFLLWQCAYAELFFSPLLWPDFDAAALRQAIDGFANRERRYGKTGAQVSTNHKTHN